MNLLFPWLRRLVVLGLCVFILPAIAAPLLVVGIHEPPYKMLEDGRYTGIDVEIMRAVLGVLDIDHEFRLLTSGSRMMRDASTGQVDVVMSLSHKPERVEYLTYPERTYKYLSWHFFIREGDVGRIRFDTFDDLASLRVGAVQSWAYTPEFWAAPLKRTLVTDHRLLIDMLLTGRIDVAPMSTAETFYLIRQRNLGQQLAYLNKPLAARPYFNVFARYSSHPELARLQAEYDRVIDELETSGVIDDIHQRFLGRDARF